MSTSLFSPTIETQRLLLRPLSNASASELLEIFADPDVMRYWNTPPWSSLDDALAFIDESREAMLRQESVTLGIYLKSTGGLVGKCMLFNYVKESRRAELGFGLGRSHWGNGYVGEAARALLQYGFDRLGLRRVEAEIDPNNRPSAKALEQLGFIEEGFLRERWEIDGIVSDSALYGLLVEDHSRAQGKA